MATISIRVNDELKQKSQELFNALGMDMSTAITVFLSQSVRESKIPFSISMTDENGFKPDEAKELRRRIADLKAGKGVDIVSFSIRLTEEEKKLASSYARLHSHSLGEAFKRALFEKIEEEYDISVFDEALSEYQNSGKKSRPVEELWQK